MVLSIACYVDRNTGLSMIIDLVDLMRWHLSGGVGFKAYVL